MVEACLGDGGQWIEPWPMTRLQLLVICRQQFVHHNGLPIDVWACFQKTTEALVIFRFADAVDQCCA